MKNLTRSAVGVMAVLLLSKGLGFVREILLAYQFGTSYIVDAYAVSSALPAVLLNLFSSGFSNSYVTVHARIQEDSIKKTFFNSAVTCLTIVALVISTLGFMFSGEIAHLLAPGYDDTSMALLRQFVSIIVFALPFMTVFSLFSAELSTRDDFITANTLDFIGCNLVIIAGIWIAARTRVENLVIGEVVAWAMMSILLAIYARRAHAIRFRPQVAIRNRYTLIFCQLAIPFGASRLISELNGVSDRIFASLLGEGVTSALSYANRVQLIFYTLTTSVFLSVCYPRMNRCFAEADREMGMYYVRKAMMLAAYISIPVAGGLYLFARPVTMLLFERGSFTAQSTAMTAGCLAFYALGIPFYALRETAAKALGANMEQRKILKNTAISVVFNILLNLALYRPLGHIGLALATSLTGLLVSVLALLDLRKKGLSMFQRGQLPDFLKIVASSAVGLLGCVLCFERLLPRVGNTLALVSAACVAVTLYGILSIALKIEIFVWMYRRLPKRLQVLPCLNQVAEE